MNNGVEVLVHIGIDTVNAKGDGFRLLKKKQGDTVKAGDPIVEADIRKLGQTYDMSTMLIITDSHDHKISFIDPCMVTKGQSLLKQ
jgi:PTS system glucose-specific IIA component